MKKEVGKYVYLQNRGQVTIFIIVAVLIIGSIVAYFMLRDRVEISIGGKTDENPESFLNSCIKDEVRNAINVLSLQGGYANPSVYRNFSFGEEGYQKITYLCYNQNNYQPCVNQKPFFIYDLREEIKRYINSSVEGCFDEMVENLKRENEVFLDYRDFEIQILPKRIVLVTDSKLTVTSSGETRDYNDLEVTVPSRLHEISVVVQELVNQEAAYGYAENHGITITYPEFDIDKYYDAAAYTNIYTVIHLDTKEKFRFAVRGYVIPPGLGISTIGTSTSGANNTQNNVDDYFGGFNFGGSGTGNFD